MYTNYRYCSVILVVKCHHSIPHLAVFLTQNQIKLTADWLSADCFRKLKSTLFLTKPLERIS